LSGLPVRCLIRGCPNPPIVETRENELYHGEAILCAEHDRQYRPRCAKCGKLLTDASVSRGWCGVCHDRRPEVVARRRALAAWKGERQRGHSAA
jgi:hypothetical protein